MVLVAMGTTYQCISGCGGAFMKVQAEVSVYPLRTPDVGERVVQFLKRLQRPGLELEVGRMSTQVTGECKLLFEAFGDAFHDVADNQDALLVLKVSNACPAKS